MSASALLRAKIEAALSARIPSALTPAPRIIRHVAATGIRNVDEVLQGGLPVGAITELVGPECSGRTSLALSFLAGMTQAGRVCAWIDVSDTLHPESAAGIGINLNRLLWVRCGITHTGTPQPSSQFFLPEMCLIPAPIKKGLHGGGHGSHPRTEMRGISSAISSLFQSQANSPVPAVPKPKLRSETMAEKPCQSPEIKDRKTKFSEKPWSRLDQALRVTDLLLQNGGFGAIVLDMGSLAPDHVLRVPLANWFRYRVAAEQKQTSILLLMQHPCAKSSAGLTLCLPSGNVLDLETTVFSGIKYCAEVVRERFAVPPTNVIPLRKSPQNQRYARWESRTAWTSR